MSLLGGLESVQFIDQNPQQAAYQRPYYKEVRKCQKVIETIRKIRKNIAGQGGKIKKCKGQDHNILLEKLRERLQNTPDDMKHLQSIEDQVNIDAKIIDTQLEYFNTVVIKRTHLLEQQYCLNNAHRILKQTLEENEQMEQKVQEQKDKQQKKNQEEVEQQQREKMEYICGMVDKKERNRLERVIFRAGRESVCQIYEDYNEELSCFVLMLTSANHSGLKSRLARLADGHGARFYTVPKDTQSREEKHFQVENQLKEVQELYQLTNNNITFLFNKMVEVGPSGVCSVIEEHYLYSLKELDIYEKLNVIERDKNVSRGYCWIPRRMVRIVQKALLKSGNEAKQVIAAELKEVVFKNIYEKRPPTWIRLNGFTKQFQQIVDTYGVPAYQEVNPGLFTIITFPFLFGVMFADILHGAILLALGSILVLANNQIMNMNSLKWVRPLASVRYLIFLIGVFSFLIGFIYNDIGSIGMDLFQSTCYSMPDDGTHIADKDDDECRYKFGLDPIWRISTNEVHFTNSLKMKISVIIGILHMIFGLLLKGSNTLYFRQLHRYYFEFLPQFIFMTGIYGWLIIIILYKWQFDWSYTQVPGLIQTLINIPLKWIYKMPKDIPLWYDGAQQEFIQNLIFVTSMLMIPLMLIPSPTTKSLELDKLPLHPDHQPEQMKYDNVQDRTVINDDSSYERDKLLNNSNISGISKFSLALQFQQNINGSVQQSNLLSSSQSGGSLAFSAIIKNKDEYSSNQSKLGLSGSFLENHDRDRSLVFFNTVHPDRLKLLNEEARNTELLIIQVIDTIEFVLCSIANTASYLRLWALSLAHSQLSKVFFDKTLLLAIQHQQPYYVIFMAFQLYIFFTLFVLVAIDSMECFLHSLRLHWIEFQSKFYKGNGYEFRPFSFQRMFQEQSDKKII